MSRSLGGNLTHETCVTQHTVPSVGTCHVANDMSHRKRVCRKTRFVVSVLSYHDGEYARSTLDEPWHKSATHPSCVYPDTVTNTRARDVSASLEPRTS